MGFLLLSDSFVWTQWQTRANRCFYKPGLPGVCCFALEADVDSSSAQVILRVCIWEHRTLGSGYYDPLKTEKLQGKTGREPASEQLKTKMLIGSKTNQPTQMQHVHNELGELQQRDSRGIFFFNDRLQSDVCWFLS